MAEKKKSIKGETEPTGAGSQIGMGGSAGLEGTSLQSPGSKAGWSGDSAGYEQEAERGSASSGGGARARRTAEQQHK